jgi:lysozyme
MAFRLRWPTEFGHITQEFGKRPEVYKEFGLPGHEGLDFQAPTGSKVFACADGVVSEVRKDGNKDRKKFPYGNQIRIRHETDEGDFTTIYAHLFSTGVVPDQQVKAGDVIGIADETGNSDGAHLHLTLKRKGATAEGATAYPNDIINPMPFLDPFTHAEGTAPAPLDGLKYQADITVPDNSPVEAGTEFVKTWRVLNTGSTAWGEGYTLAFFNDEQMGAPDAVPLPPTEPGEFAEVSVTLTAPDAPGFRRSTWKAKNPAGEFFGQILFALISVPEPEERARLNVVIDLSHHNTITDWQAICDDGIVAVIHKATQGTGFVDERYAGRRERARELDLLWGAYHFGEGGDPVGQARHFLDTAQPDDRTLLALDFERNPHGSSMRLVEAEAFVRHVREETGRWPVLYTGRWYIREFIGDAPSTLLSECPLWVAYYQEAPVLPAQWRTWTLWQYTDGAAGPEPRAVRGVVRCDRNWFNGPREELELLWGRGIG